MEFTRARRTFQSFTTLKFLPDSSEVFEENSAKLQSWDFIDALSRCADKYPEECKVYNIRESFEYAIGQLNDKVYQQRFPLKND